MFKQVLIRRPPDEPGEPRQWMSDAEFCTECRERIGISHDFQFCPYCGARGRDTAQAGYYEKALLAAAEEAYQSEVVDTESVEETIGDGGSYSSEDEWIGSKIEEWVREGNRRRGRGRVGALPPIIMKGRRLRKR
jgi:hypothetical protein